MTPVLTKIATLYRASYAYPGWGIADWYKDRYVQLSCGDTQNLCVDDSLTAYSSDLPQEGFKYPLIDFCPRYFDLLKPHAQLITIIDANLNSERLNVANLKGQGQSSKYVHLMN